MDREGDLLGIEDLKYDEAGLIPAVIQDDVTGDVLMVAYMNAESLAKTIETGKTWFWSRSRQKYWMKGESSGHVQDVHELRYDCDADCLLVRVAQHGSGACHTNERSCFYRRLYPEPQSLSGTDAQETASAAAEGPTTRLGAVLDELYVLLESRKAELPEGSYTAKLLSGPLDSLLKKIAEESGEVIMAAKDADRGGERAGLEHAAADLGHLRYEIADLVYHLLVVMVRGGLTPADLATELEGRRKG